MRRAVFPGLCLLLAVATASSPAQAVPTEADVPQVAPNVVLILLDDARYDDLTTMPQVKSRIAEEGATFTHFYSSFPLCCPARATLLSGQYPHNHGVLSNKAPTGGFKEFADASTLATWLDPTYRTGFVGKYFNAYRPPYKPPGWNEWIVPYDMYNYAGTSWYVNHGAGGSNVTYPGWRTDTMGNLAADFVTRNAASAEPFFLYTSLVAPHAGSPVESDDPAAATPAVDSRYRDWFAGLASADPSFNEADVSDKPLKPALLGPAAVATFTEVNAQRREAELSAQDATIKVLDALQASGELANTYLVFMSDNGYMLGEHRIRGGKIHPYEVASRVPLMVRGPGIAPGTVIDDVTAQVDFAPTVLSMTGAVSADPTTLDGIDLLPGMLNPATTTITRPAVLLEATNTNATTDPLPWLYHGVVSDQWKYVERGSGHRELYDLANDPYELDNVAGKPQYATVQQNMAAHLDTYKWCQGVACRS